MKRGKTPITKNIRVIDTMGNEYEATYPKRARGLVKSGRATFIDEYTLCLGCPPNDYLEAKPMNNEQLQNVPETEDRSNGPRPSGISREWLEKIDVAAIAEHMECAHIVELVKVLPKEVLMRTDFTAIAENMESPHIVALVRLLPKECLDKLDINAIVENMDSPHIVAFMKSLFG